VPWGQASLQKRQGHPTKKLIGQKGLACRYTVKRQGGLLKKESQGPVKDRTKNGRVRVWPSQSWPSLVLEKERGIKARAKRDAPKGKSNCS